MHRSDSYEIRLFSLESDFPREIFQANRNMNDLMQVQPDTGLIAHPDMY